MENRASPLSMRSVVEMEGAEIHTVRDRSLFRGGGVEYGVDQLKGGITFSD